MLKLSNKKYIWIIGSPRSGTTLLTKYLCNYTDGCYDEPWSKFNPKESKFWKFPNVKTIAFKYCMNWTNAATLNKYFKKSYFIHIIRNPSDVIYSLVFPKKNSVPFRDIFSNRNIEKKFDGAVGVWYNYTCGSTQVCNKYNGIEIYYDDLPNQIDKLAAFIDLPLNKNDLLFNNRNKVETDENKFQFLENLWKSNKYQDEYRKKKSIEDLLHKFSHTN